MTVCPLMEHRKQSELRLQALCLAPPWPPEATRSPSPVPCPWLALFHSSCPARSGFHAFLFVEVELRYAR